MLPHHSTRLEAFSDAAFAFALTLLVVSLDMPRTYDELMDLLYGFGSFACCFALLTWIWWEHAAFFQKYPLQDPVTVAINGVLLFVVLFYVYPLKFMFDSLFAMWIPAPTTMRPVLMMEFWQLGNASAVYGFGFLLLFLVFALLCDRAYRKRDELGLGAIEVFDLRSDIGHHLVSAAVGALAMAFALLAPLNWVFISPMLFALMGPAHVWWGRRRSAQRMVPEIPEPTSTSHVARRTWHVAHRTSHVARGTGPPMPRNAEVIRQWTILRDLEASRRLTIDDLAGRTGVTTRTIRRDLDALQSAGFPLFDEVHDGKKYWTLEQRAFRRLDDTGFTLAELSALYFSRTLVECLAATPFQRDVRSAFEKLAAALTPGMRQFLDRLPLVMQAKRDPGAPIGDATAARHGGKVAQLLDATLHHRRITMRYRSLSSGRDKDYMAEPYRLVFSHGALYLTAFVPEYSEFRTFAVERLLSLSVSEDRFEPVEIEGEAFAHSLGVHEGPPERIEIVFEPRIAPYMKEREWHSSQQIRDEQDGSIVLTLDVCNDFALRSWILGFGPLARVVSPPHLAAQILAEIEGARLRYALE